jgi:hypothetical protein
MREGLSEEQIAYEQWVDRQPLGDVVGWEEMEEGEREDWCREVLGREWKGEGYGEGEKSMIVEPTGEGEQSEAVGDLGESRWIAVRAEPVAKEQLASETQVVAELEECPLISAGMFQLQFEKSIPRL